MINFLHPNHLKKPPKKYQKISKPETPTTSEIIEPAREEYMKSNPTLSFDIVSSFIINSYGNPDPIGLTETYNVDIQDMLKSIDELYPFITSTTLKSRCTRLIKKIRKRLDGKENPNDPNDTDTSSICSQ